MVVVIGHLTVDDIVLPDGRTAFETPGGNSVYAALGAALWDVPVTVLACKSPDYPDATWQALQEVPGVDWTHVHHIRAPAARQWALYDVRGGRQYLALPRSSDYLTISPHPRMFGGVDWEQVTAVHLAPMPFSVVQEWVEWLRAYPHLYLQIDPHENEIEPHLSEWVALLRTTDTFLPSEVEAERFAQVWPHLSDQGSHIKPRLVVKLGPRGSVIYGDDGRPVSIMPVSGDFVDPTGCGDAYAGGFIAAMHCQLTRAQAGHWGAVSASFALQGYGPHGLIQASRGMARSRLRQHLNLAQ